MKCLYFQQLNVKQNMTSCCIFPAAKFTCLTPCAMCQHPITQRAEMRMVRWMFGVNLKDRLPSNGVFCYSRPGSALGEMVLLRIAAMYDLHALMLSSLKHFIVTVSDLALGDMRIKVFHYVH